jgi:mannose-6-phosphate isomerase
MLRKVEKPWGHEEIWARSRSESGYVGKLLFIKAGHQLSFQYHEEKEETIMVKSGILYLHTMGVFDDMTDLKIVKLFPGQTFHVPVGLTHRFAANEVNVELIEVSTHQLDDVVRIEDDYGR